MKFFVDEMVSGYGVFCEGLSDLGAFLNTSTEEQAKQAATAFERVYDMGHGAGVVEMKRTLGLLPR